MQPYFIFQPLSSLASPAAIARRSQKFVQMFLTCYNGEGQGISLADASVWILGEGGEANPRGSEKATINQEVKGIKTKVRRLYDIANVMVAIGVIEKVGDAKGEKKVRMDEN